MGLMEPGLLSGTHIIIIIIIKYKQIATFLPYRTNKSFQEEEKECKRNVIYDCSMMVKNNFIKKKVCRRNGI